VVHMGEKHNSNTVLTVKMGKETSWKKQKYEDNIKVGIKEGGWEGADNSSGVAQGEVVIVKR